MIESEELFLLLTAAATADGRIDAGEREILLRYAAGMGIAESRAHGILGEARPGNTDALRIPEDETERAWIASGLVEVVSADRKLAPAERGFLERLIARLGIEPAEIPGMAQE